MQRSESIADLATALAQAQAEIENATKNAANPHFRSRYADLAEVLNTARPVLAKHGIAVVQSTSYADKLVHVDTLLTHKSGQWLESHASAPIGKDDVQGVGSVTTYLRRYSLAAMVGIAQEDDDGESAVRPQKATDGESAVRSQKATAQPVDVKPRKRVASAEAKSKARDVLGTNMLTNLDEVEVPATLPEHERLALRVLMQQRRAEIAGGTWEASDEREALAGQWIRNEVGG